MRLLEEVLGQRTIINEVLRRQSSPQKECLLVSGNVGSGLSWTLDCLGTEWERRGGVALKASGVALTPTRALLPWLTMASPARTTLARWDVLKGGAAAASKTIPVVGEVAKFLVTEVLGYRRRKLDSQLQMLSEKEQDLLYVMDAAAGKKRLLLLLDHVGHWDRESWSLLEIIVSRVLDGYYTSLKDVFIVIASNEETLPRCRKLTEDLASSEMRIPQLKRDDVPEVTKVLGYPECGIAELDLVYEATGGRLDLLHELGVLFRETGASSIGQDTTTFTRMIERRMRGLKGNVVALEQLLAAASFLGRSSPSEEVYCLSGISKEELRSTLSLALEQNLVDNVSGYFVFRSIAIQQYFRSRTLNASRLYHAKFADCLRKLRPGDYASRREHLLLSESLTDAMICHCLASLEARRQRRTIEVPEEIKLESEWANFEAYLRLMDEAQKAHDEDSLEEGLVALESIEAVLPDILLAERDYLEAQILLKFHSISHFHQAANILQQWEHLRDVEPEVWSRVSLALIVAFSETGKHDEAVQLEKLLTRYYGDRQFIDPWALYGLNCLRRRSECLHHFVPARTRLESALTYFGPATRGSVPRHPLQLYYTLSNLVSNLVAYGSFTEAMLRASELKILIEEGTLQQWPSIEIAANNSILAEYLAGDLPVTMAVALLREIEERREDVGDRVLISNNLAALLIHDEQLDEAMKILTRLWNRLTDHLESDPYHRYFVGNNLAAVHAIRGSTSIAEDLLLIAGTGLPRLYPAIRETLRTRHKILLELLRETAHLSVKEYDSLLLKHYPPQMGPQWAFYGRGVLFSDIQIWASE